MATYHIIMTRHYYQWGCRPYPQQRVQMADGRMAEGLSHMEARALCAELRTGLPELRAGEYARPTYTVVAD